MRIIVIGFDAITHAFVQLLHERSRSLYARHGFAPTIVGVADAGRAVVAEGGLDLTDLLAAKATSAGIVELARDAHPILDAEEAICEAPTDVIIDTTSSALAEPGPGIRHLKAAFRSGLHAVTVNLAPLARALPGLRELADYNRVLFRFSGCVGAGTPMLAFAEQCAQGDDIVELRAVFDGPANRLLCAMHDGRLDFDAARALAAPPNGDAAETDMDGVATAIKLVIFANVILNRKTTLDDTHITGIRDVDRRQIEAAAAQQKHIKLVGSIGEGINVAPAEVRAGGLLDVPGDSNAISLTLRHAGEVTLAGRGGGAKQIAAAILRDLLNIWHEIGSRS